MSLVVTLSIKKETMHELQLISGSDYSTKQWVHPKFKAVSGLIGVWIIGCQHFRDQEQYTHQKQRNGMKWDWSITTKDPSIPQPNVLINGSEVIYHGIRARSHCVNHKNKILYNNLLKQYIENRGRAWDGVEPRKPIMGQEPMYMWTRTARRKMAMRAK